MPSPFTAWARNRDPAPMPERSTEPRRSEQPSAYLVREIGGGLCLLFDRKQADAYVGKPITAQVVPLFEGEPIYDAGRLALQGAQDDQ